MGKFTDDGTSAQLLRRIAGTLNVPVWSLSPANDEVATPTAIEDQRQELYRLLARLDDCEDRQALVTLARAFVRQARSR